MKRKVLWISRHDMTVDQRADLARILHTASEELEIVQHSDTVKDVEVLGQYLTGDLDAICAVLPHELLARLWQMTSAASKPLFVAKNRRDRNAAGEFVFVHDGWDLVLECRYRFKRM